MFYIDLKQTNDVLLTFEALKVKFFKILVTEHLINVDCLCVLVYNISVFYLECFYYQMCQ